MKKALAFLMAAVMLMSMLTACGNKDNAGNKDNNDVNTEETDKAAADKVAALIDAIGDRYRGKKAFGVKFSRDGSTYALSGCKLGQRTLKVEVTAVTENATKADAPAMYKELP